MASPGEEEAEAKAVKANLTHLENSVGDPCICYEQRIYIWFPLPDKSMSGTSFLPALGSLYGTLPTFPFLLPLMLDHV